MEIIFNNIIINSVSTSWGEEAWNISDICDLLDFLSSKNEIILGGDILSKDLTPTYDSWYYNKESNVCMSKQSQKSISIAKMYITDYIKNNGSNYYVVIVPDLFNFS